MPCWVVLIPGPIPCINRCHLNALLSLRHLKRLSTKLVDLSMHRVGLLLKFQAKFVHTGDPPLVQSPLVQILVLCSNKLLNFQSMFWKSNFIFEMPTFFWLDQKQLFTTEFHLLNHVQYILAFSKWNWISKTSIHSMAMDNLNKSKETTPMTTTALKEEVHFNKELKPSLSDLTS